jgi:hypothetical protein
MPFGNLVGSGVKSGREIEALRASRVPPMASTNAELGNMAGSEAAFG